MEPLIFTGLAVGLAFGFVLQRGRFCMNSSFRDVVLLKDNTLLKAVGVALLVELIGFAILDLTDVITLNPKPLFWGANLLGSFVFGIGMVLAGGCASGITYRVGEGMAGSIAAVIGLATGGTLTAIGFLSPLREMLQTDTKIVTDEGANLTLANLFGVPHWVMALGIALVVIVLWVVLANRNRSDEDVAYAGNYTVSERIFKRGWGWLTTGFLIGLVGIVAFPLSAAAGRNYPLGITAGWVGIVKVGLPNVDASMNWIAMLIIGIMLGSAAAALIAGEFKFRRPSWGTLGQTFIGGLLMGFGAVCSSGCNIGHILSGVPQLSLGSILAGISIILGAWLMAYLMFVRPHAVAMAAD